MGLRMEFKGHSRFQRINLPLIQHRYYRFRQEQTFPSRKKVDFFCRSRAGSQKPKAIQSIGKTLMARGAQALLFRFGIQIQLLDRNTHIGQLWYTMNF